MASMQDGPVGVSYEVPGADAQSATENAWRQAEAAGRELGVTLFAEQIEAGKWEVVLQDNGPAGSGIPQLTPAEADAFREYVKGLDEQAAELMGLPGTGANLLSRIGDWFEEAKTNPDAENRHLGAIALLGEARSRIEALEAVIIHRYEEQQAGEQMLAEQAEEATFRAAGVEL